MRTQGHQDFFQRIRGVGIIDHHQGLAATAQALHATGRTLEFWQHTQNFIQRVVQPQQCAYRGQHVAQVESPQQGAAQMVFTLWRHQRGAYAFVVERSFTAIQVGTGIFQAIGNQARLALVSNQRPTELVIKVDDPALQVVPAEQPGFRLAVGLHGAVVIQVIARQVGQHSHIKCQRTDTPLVQAMGRHFHGDGLGTGLFQVGQGRLNGDGVRRGVQAAFQRAMETAAQGAHDAAVLPQQVQRLRDQLGHTGFTVGAGHANQVQVTARLAIKAPGDIGQLRGQALHRNQWHIGNRQDGCPFDFIRHRRRAALQGIGNVRTTVELATRHGKEQVACPHATAVQGQFADQQVMTCVGKNLVQAKRH
ncbi:hypothetical protein D3C85_755200 [compost metagenome]